MRTFVFFTFILLTFQCHSSEYRFQTWRFLNNFEDFIDRKKDNLLISKNCFLRKKPFLKKQCINKIQTIKSLQKKIPKKRGGVNPGALICKNSLKGTVLLGIDINGNERSFCQIDKNIIIDNLWLMNNAGKENVK